MPLQLLFKGNRIEKNGLKFKQPKIWKDWYLPSRDEFTYMVLNLYDKGLGNFNFNNNLSDRYWTSWNNMSNSAVYRADGSGSLAPKDTIYHVRPSRNFIAPLNTYSIGDIGPAGGWIFYIMSGTKYFEAGPYDLDDSVWSNVTNSLVSGTDSYINSGLQNSLNIVNQPGHTNSAAKLCLDFVHLYG